VAVAISATSPTTSTASRKANKQNVAVQKRDLDALQNMKFDGQT
jgi:hypothetical protein